MPRRAITKAPELQVDSYDVRVGENLGEIVLVKIEKKKYWVQDDWFCRYISVKTPSGEYVEFPCFRWLVGDNEVVLRDGKGGTAAAASQQEIQSGRALRAFPHV